MRPDPFFLARVDSKQQGLYRQLRVLTMSEPSTTVDHHHVINLSSNNHLGLTTHPRLRAGAGGDRALGVGTGSVRTIAGTMDIHMELERRLQSSNRPRRSSSFRAGSRRTPERCRQSRRKTTSISDEPNHASIIDGSRLSRADIKVFPHKDVAAARKIPIAASRPA
jgi:glycine C-acetyltransferase